MNENYCVVCGSPEIWTMMWSYSSSAWHCRRCAERKMSVMDMMVRGNPGSTNSSGVSVVKKNEKPNRRKLAIEETKRRRAERRQSE